MAGKSSKQLERHLKGLANHRRLDILMLVAKREGITLEQIAETLNWDIKIISQHTQKLAQSGLLDKKYAGRNVQHFLSPYGKTFHHFLQTL
jgi:DNA-binding MarR family transcriptional regulator